MRNYLILAASLAATTVQAQTLPPVRPLGATVARSTEQMTAVTTAVPLPGGKVLVNDILKRRVLLFDSTYRRSRSSPIPPAAQRMRTVPGQAA